jgi:hypothetical protein
MVRADLPLRRANLIAMTRTWFVIALVWLIHVVVTPNTIQSQSSHRAAASTTQFDPQPWLEDFQQLTDAMASHYADLEWAMYERRMDLPSLRQDMEKRLRQASDEQAAHRIFEKFLDSFGDGHLSIAWPKPVDSSPVTETTADGSLCSRLGYKASSAPGIDFSLFPGFRTLGGKGSELFSGGLLTLQNGTKLGLIRIALLNEHAFPEECEQAVLEMRLADEGKCDEHCEHDIALGTANRLTAEIVKRAQQFRSVGASALLVDVTDNGGGSDWNEAVVRSLSSVPLVEDHRGFIKHEHWTTELEIQLRSVEADLKSGAEPKAVLEEAATRLRSAIARGKESCDRSPAFREGKLDCSLVVDDILFWSGVLPYAKPGSFASFESRTTLFHPLRYEYSEDAHRLPLYVAVDRHTWSSAERFASLLQDNGAATIVGELTGGAGCGFTNGGIPTTLTHSHAQVKMPDCVGLRKDGSNGNDGVTPDILVPWASRDTPFMKASKLLRALEEGAKHRSRKNWAE